MTAPQFTLPGGRPARTAGELGYVRALKEHARARSQLGEAVEAEREAFKALLRRLSETGPVHSAAEAARQAWAGALAVKQRAARAVEAADDHVLEASRAWAVECAGGYARQEAAHG